MVLCNSNVARRYTNKPVFLKAATVRTRGFGSFEIFSTSLPLEQTPSPTVQASQDAYELAGVGPEDIDIVLPSHLHLDHIGWNTHPGPDGEPIITAPSARHTLEIALAMYQSAKLSEPITLPIANEESIWD